MKSKIGTMLMMTNAHFRPTNISGLRLWLSADDLEGADGDMIAAWNDKTSNGNNFTQTTDEKKPLLKKDNYGINGHNSIRFDGTDDIMVASNFSSATQGSIFIVGKLNGALQNTQTILGTCDEETAASYYWNYRPFFTDFSAQVCYVRTSSGPNIQGGFMQTFNMPSIWHIASNGSAYVMRHNGRVETLTVAGGTNNGDWFGDIPNRDNFTLGGAKWNAEAAFFKGDVAEVIIYDTSLSAADVARVERYLANKYAIPLGELDGSGLVLDDSWRTDGPATFTLQEKVGITNPVLSVADVTDYANPFAVGDPFVVKEGGIYYMFHKVTNTDLDTVTAYSTSTDGLTWTYQRVILDEITAGDHDIYFPHVFKASGTYYMFQGITRNQLTLFRALRFPDRWVVVDVLMNQGYPFVNVVPVYWGGLWYIMGWDMNEDPRVMRVFYSADLFGGTYTEHPSSPIIIDEVSRSPVGRPIIRDASIDLFLYDSDYLGGEAIRHFGLTTLSTTEFVVTELADSPLLYPGGDTWEAGGHHTMDKLSPSLTYADGLPWGAGDSLSIGIWEDVP